MTTQQQADDNHQAVVEHLMAVVLLRRSLKETWLFKTGEIY